MFVLIGVGLVSSSAVAQQKSGTAIIFSVTPEKAIVSADSRELDSTHKIATDQGCKIVAFDNRAIFTFSGTRVCQVSQHNEWDAQKTALSVYKRLRISNKVVRAKDFMLAWDEELRLHTTDFVGCSGVHNPDGGMMTALYFNVGLFGSIEAIDDELTVKQSPSNGPIFEHRIAEIALNGLPMGSGHMDILDEFLADRSDRAKSWHKQIDAYSPERRIQALGQLTRRFDDSGSVGGNIDMAVLTSNGVKWISTKQQCQTQQ